MPPPRRVAPRSGVASTRSERGRPGSSGHQRAAVMVLATGALGGIPPCGGSRRCGRLPACACRSGIAGRYVQGPGSRAVRVAVKHRGTHDGHPPQLASRVGNLPTPPGRDSPRSRLEWPIEGSAVTPAAASDIGPMSSLAAQVPCSASFGTRTARSARSAMTASPAAGTNVSRTAASPSRSNATSAPRGPSQDGACCKGRGRGNAFGAASAARGRAAGCRQSSASSTRVPTTQPGRCPTTALVRRSVVASYGCGPAASKDRTAAGAPNVPGGPIARYPIRYFAFGVRRSDGCRHTAPAAASRPRPLAT